MQITIPDGIVDELKYIVKLHQEHGAPNPQTTVEQLVNYVLASIADGSRRPGSWERDMLERMGIVANCIEHQDYRSNYGEPTE